MNLKIPSTIAKIIRNAVLDVVPKPECVDGIHCPPSQEVFPSVLREHGADKHTDVARELFVGSSGNKGPSGAAESYSLGYHITSRFADGLSEKQYVELKVPDDFVSMISCHVVVMPTGTGNMRWSVGTHFGVVGELRSNTASSKASVDEAVVDDVITELSDMSEALPGLSAGDYVGIEVTRSGNHANDTVGAHVYMLGVILKYMAHQ